MKICLSVELVSIKLSAEYFGGRSGALGAFSILQGESASVTTNPLGYERLGFAQVVAAS